MAIKVLTIDSEYESAKRLGFPTHTYMGDYVSKFDGDTIIRWGNSGFVFNNSGVRNADFKSVINRATVIRQNCKKNEATKLMAQVVNVPTLYEKSVPKGVLAVIRPIEHAAGNGFSVKEGPFKIEPGTYGTRFLQTDAEYRVWFCGDNTMLGRRVKMKSNEEQEYPCRSNWGYSFCKDIALELHYQTLIAAKKIGLDCGAADVLYFKKRWYFLELNSAASVDHRQVREFYQKALEELVKKKQEEVSAKNQIEKKEPTAQVVPPEEKEPTVQVVSQLENTLIVETMISNEFITPI